MRRLLLVASVTLLTFGVSFTSLRSQSAPKPLTNTAVNAQKKPVKKPLFQKEAFSGKSEKAVRDNILRSKYGMNAGQIANYEALLQKMETDFKALDQAKITGIPRAEKRKAVRDEFRAGVMKILEAKQYIAWNKDFVRHVQKEVGDFTLKTYQAEVDKMPATLNFKQRQAKRSEIRSKYIKWLAVSIGDDAARKMFDSYDRKRDINHNEEIRLLKLPYDKSVQMLGMKQAHMKKLDKIRKETISPKECRLKIQAENDAYEKSIRNFLGEQKYTQRQQWLAGSFDRKLKRQWGFDKQDTEAYKKLKSAEAIAKLKVRQSAKSQPEKDAEIKRIETETETKVKQAISPKALEKRTKQLAADAAKSPKATAK